VRSLSFKTGAESSARLITEVIAGLPVHHLAQINIARMRAPLNAPIMKGFVDQLVEVNQTAEASPGFVWRLKSEEGDATSIRAYEDELILVNMSVWESIESLREFTYRSHHAGMFRDRQQWFERSDGAQLALWWIPVGHIPTVEEGKGRLALLGKLGPTQEAFTFKQSFAAAV
jgi:hypothetical protein